VDEQTSRFAPGPAQPADPGNRYVFRSPDVGRRRAVGLTLPVVVVVSLVLGLLAGAVAAALTVAVGDRLDRLPGLVPDLAPASQGRVPASQTTRIADQVLPTVVSLSVRGDQQSATGSGFVIDPRGYVATNSHVVSPAADGGSVVVTFSNGQRVRGEIVGRSPTYDLAVVKVPIGDLQAVTFGDSDLVRVGDPVVAVGAPLGLTGTVTTGIVSAVDRPVTTSDAGEASYISALQTDAAINPGNSGGPLVDRRGHVIAIASAIATIGAGQSGSIGLGFGIPMNQARTVLQQLIGDGEAQYPVVGVLLDLTYRGVGARIQDESAPGQAVTPGGPAERAGLQPGDRVVAVDGQTVATPEEFVVVIRSNRPGETVTLTVVRDGQRLTVPVTLGGARG
jgi:putative serine protease PepD